MNFDQAAYGQDDPADTPSDAVGPTLCMVEVARYWNRGGARLSLAEEVAEAGRAQRLSVVLDLLGEVSSPLAPHEVLQVGSDDWTAAALTRLGFRVETTTSDPVLVTSAWLFDLVLVPEALLPLDDPTWLAAVVNLSSLVRLGGRLVVGGAAEEAVRSQDLLFRAAAQYRAVLESRGFRLERVQPVAVPIGEGPGALLAWTRES